MTNISTLLRVLMWEMSKNGHLLLLGIVGGVLPLFLLLWLLTSVGLPLQSPELIRTHAFLMPFSFMAMFLGIIGFQGSVRRLYSYPLSDSSIALWHMLSGIAIIALGYILIITGLNQQFDAGWPIVGPTLYFVMSFAIFQPYTRITNKTVSTIITIPVLVLILAIGFLTRYSIVGSQPKMWSELSVLEISIFGGTTVWSMFSFQRSIKIDRHNLGETDPLVELWISVESWTRNQLPQFGVRRSKLRHAFAAQCWLLWRLNRSHITIAVLVLFMTCGFFIVFGEPEITSTETKTTFSSIQMFPLILATIFSTTMGIGLGSFSSDSTASRDKETYEDKLQNINFLNMGSFFSTLPISNTRLSNTILVTAFRGVFTITLCNVIAACVFYLFGIDMFTDISSSGHFGLYCLLFLVVPWTATGMTSTVCLMGSNRFLLVAAGLVAAELILFAFPLSRPISILFLAASTSLATAYFLTIRLVRTVGQPNSLASEDKLQIGFAICLWLALLAISWQVPELKSMETFCVGFILLSSIAVLPIAAMTLAIGNNRTR